jgi:ornithine cyclodeaminase/alanine dehydrogenase-like protein (mu-crystallin family)
VVHPRPDAFINAMPAYLGGSDRVGIKWVSGYEGNREKGLPYIYGIFLLTDADTGRPLALIDGGWITEIRTAGVSGVVLRHVPCAPRALAAVGCGVQGRRHLDAILAERPEIEEVRAYDRAPEATARFLAGAGDRRTLAADSPEEAVEGADLVVTAVTVRLERRLTAEGTAEDVVLLPVDYDDAMDPAAAHAAACYVVDDLGQYRSFTDEHFAGFPEPGAELGEVVAGTFAVPEQGRRMFMNLGIAMDDVALGALVHDLARERGLGLPIAFP